MRRARSGWLRRCVPAVVVLAVIAGAVAASTSLPAGAHVSKTAAWASGSVGSRTAPTLARGPQATTIGGPEEARQAAARAAQTLPLPAGGNFNGIRWEEAGGTFTEADVAFVTQYNATCQWYRALRDGRDAQRAARVVHEAAGWPAIRDTEAAAGLVAAAHDVLAGGLGPAARALIDQCQAAHDREVAWAARLGLPPSS
jgi:hypothetical protein